MNKEFITADKNTVTGVMVEFSQKELTLIKEKIEVIRGATKKVGKTINELDIKKIKDESNTAVSGLLNIFDRLTVHIKPDEDVSKLLFAPLSEEEKTVKTTLQLEESED